MAFVWLFFILLVLFVFVILLDRLIEKMYQNPKARHRATPENHNIPFEEIRIPVGKDGELYGWWIPASPGALTLILVHGWGRNVARMLPFIRKLHPMGYNLLAFDARNHGGSTPEKHPSVWSFTQDTLAAVDFVARGSLGVSGEIGVLGLSVGGGAAIDAAALDGRIRSVVTVGAFSHPVEVMKLEFQKRRIPYIPFVWLFFKYLQLRSGLNFDRVAPENNIRPAQADIFLIHGHDDATIPLEQGEALYRAGNPDRTRFWIVPGKGHSDCHTHPQFWEKVGAFLQEMLPLETGAKQTELGTK
ncbi:MAG: alpha/beta hydrolase [Anaerolineales bacterium]